MELNLVQLDHVCTSLFCNTAAVRWEALLESVRLAIEEVNLFGGEEQDAGALGASGSGVGDWDAGQEFAGVSDFPAVTRQRSCKTSSIQ